ncbi:MAG TPA: hypothetical protein VE261_06795, partial [Gaiellaceae bacterium]|nr:hypothetical protein [Gaiellaceae bacterium]
MRRFGFALVVAAALAAPGAAAPAGTTHQRWCKARPSVGWQRVLRRHVVAITKTTPMVPIALARDGHSFFAEVHSASFAGVARIDTTTGSLAKIKEFPDSQFDQAWGAFDGRWLVWNEYHGYDNFNDFTTWAWDAQTHALTQLGAATRASDGQFWESPWR